VESFGRINLLCLRQKDVGWFRPQSIITRFHKRAVQYDCVTATSAEAIIAELSYYEVIFSDGSTAFCRRDRCLLSINS